jgi:hypothetical protein
MFSDPVCRITRQQLTKEGVYIAVDEPEGGHIVDSLLELHGIERVEVTPHSIYITKALLVGWNDLLNSILLLVKTRLEERLGNEVRLSFIKPNLLETVTDGVHEQFKCWVMNGCAQEPPQKKKPGPLTLVSQQKKPRIQ